MICHKWFEFRNTKCYIWTTTVICSGPSFVLDIHQWISQCNRFSQLFHFADHICLLYNQSEIPKTNKSQKKDFKKTFILAKCKQNLIILSKTKNRVESWDLNYISWKCLNRPNYVKYLRIKIDENLNWKIHIHDL